MRFHFQNIFFLRYLYMYQDKKSELKKWSLLPVFQEFSSFPQTGNDVIVVVWINFFRIRFGRYLAYTFGINWLKKPLVFTYGLSAYFYISWAIPLAFLIELLLDLWRKWFNLGKLDDNLLFFILFSSRLKFTIIVSVYTYSKYIIFSSISFWTIISLISILLELRIRFM